MKQIKFFALLGLVGLLLTGGSAFAKHRRHSRGGGGSTNLRNMLRPWPEASISAGKCDIKVDCAHYKISVNGEDAGQIICGRQTGKSFAHKTVRLNTTIRPSMGTYLPAGYPMLSTTPSLCGSCFIHVFPYLGPSAHSLGCVGISKTAWNKITKCGGSEIAFTSMDGRTASKTPETQFASHINSGGHSSPAVSTAAGDSVNK